MTNKEAKEVLIRMRQTFCSPDRFVTPSTEYCLEAFNLAIKALETIDDINQTVYRNEKCDRAGKCIDYIGWHCSGCNGAKETSNEQK